jgi:hypothetical protein
MNVRKAGEVSHHRMSRDQLAGPLDTVYDKAVIRTANEEEGSHHMQPVARSKAASSTPLATTKFGDFERRNGRTAEEVVRR